MKWRREEYIELMTYGKIERPMFVELFGLLIGLDKEWEMQGASKDEIALEAFDFDYIIRRGCGADTGLRSGIVPRIIEETSEHTIRMDEYGRKTKLCKGYATIPLPMDHPVKDMDSWLKIKHWFEFSESRIDWNAVDVLINILNNFLYFNIRRVILIVFQLFLKYIKKKL